MICLVDETKRNLLQDFFVKEPDGAQLQAYWDGYGAQYSFCRFYLQIERGRVCGVVALKKRGAVYHTVRPSRELAKWACWMEVPLLSGNCPLPLAAYRETTGCVFFADTSHPPKSSGCGLRPQTAEQAIEMLRHARPDLSLANDDWYLETSHLMRHGVLNCWALPQKGMVAVSNLRHRTLVCSCLAVFLNKRRQGVGRQILTELAGRYPNRRLLVLSENAGSDAFYRACGLRESGRWYEYRLAGEKEDEVKR